MASSTSAGGSDNLDAERRALLSLVQESGGKKPWSTSLRGWSTDSEVPLCDWQGVSCRYDTNRAVVVTGVNITATGLSGTIPAALGSLTELEELSLGNNMLRGSIPQEVANLKKLRTLDLTRCFLTGTLPRRFESPHLSRLLLADNAISGRFFERGDGDGDDDAPSHLQSLREIRMENNLLTGTLHGPSIAENMPNLEILSLSDNDLSGLIPGELGSLSSLRYLYLDANHFVGPLPSRLARAGHASSILELWVQDNALSGTVPASYARFEALRDFFVDGNKLTGALPPDLCGPLINADFFADAPAPVDGKERDYCHSIACPAGSVAREGMYPCTECPGGEAARLRNRYLGQTGECIDDSEREVLEILHKATTKGGHWSGTNDWNQKQKPICQMTGIECDAQNHVVGISLKNRNLQGRIPDQLGSLRFLERLDLSDNALMGHVPSDLRWTSLTRLDLSGNRLRGIIPPLLCRMEELNGNGKDDGFHCDRIACPAGTSNTLGFSLGNDGEECQPCYDQSPYIGQKFCAMQSPQKADWKETVHAAAKGTGEKIRDVSLVNGLGIALGAFTIAVALCWLGHKRLKSQKEWGKLGTTSSDDHGASSASYNSKGGENGRLEEQQSFVDNGHRNFRRRNSPREMNGRGDLIYRSENDELPYNQEEGDSLDDYSFTPNGHSRYRAAAYRDFSASTENEDDASEYSSNDATRTPWSQRSASDFIKEHQGIALNKREKLKRAMSGRLPARDMTRKTVSTINIGARRRWHAHITG